eukprot:tig00000605_g2510.t1
MSAYAPRFTAMMIDSASQFMRLLCMVAAPHGELRLRLARHPGLIPALLHLASADRPVPRLYPEDSAPNFASAALRTLLSAPVVVGETAPPTAPPPGPGASSSSPERRMPPPGHEGLDAELAAARGAQAAFLAVPGEPVATLAKALERCVTVFDFADDMAQRYASAADAVACCLNEGDGPKLETLRAAVGTIAERALELAACLADLCAFREHARAVLPHIPLLLRLFPVAAGTIADPAFEIFALRDPNGVLRIHYNFMQFDNEDVDTPFAFTSPLLHSLFTAHARLRAHFPAACPPLDAGLAALATRQAETLKARRLDLESEFSSPFLLLLYAGRW